MAFFITLGAILMLLGALVCRSYSMRYSEYRSFPAEVLGFRSEFEIADDKEIELLCTVVDYKNGSETVRASHESFIPADDITYQRGDSISVQVAPETPDKFLFTSEVKGKSPFGFAMVIGGALTIVFHILWGLIF